MINTMAFTIFHILMVLFPQPLIAQSLHSEAHEAKSLVDSLSFKLHHQLNELKNLHQKTAQQISETKQELVTVKKVQTLLAQLSGNQKRLGNTCEDEYFVPGYFYRQKIMIESSSALPVHYTIQVTVNHKALIDENKVSTHGQDLHVFYSGNNKVLPVEIDRLVTGLGTTTASVQFRLQKAISSNTVDHGTYSIVFGSESDGSAKADLNNVYAFYEDFSNPSLSRWTNVWGEWSVKNGTVFGKTGRSPYGNGEVGLYVKEGVEWGDIEVELDMMETGLGTVYPGPFVRVQNPSLPQTTAWWFEYYTDHKECTMRPFINNKDGTWKYKCQLPENFVKNKWFHFKYRLHGNSLSQWANGQSIQTASVASEWMIPKGTIALGCHRTYSGSPQGCRSFYDNIRVRLVVASNPTVSTTETCRLTHHRDLLIGGKKLPADSCKQIYDASILHSKKPLAKNGVYWIKTSRNYNEAVQTYCDMKNGGWTLAGKIGAQVGNIHHSWLVQNVNLQFLKSPYIGRREGYACLDSRFLAVEHASEVMFSSGENPQGIGRRWVRWQLPEHRDYSTWWNHRVGYSRVEKANQTQVTVTAWDGSTKVCYQNKYGIMPVKEHGGSYPYTSFNKQGNTVSKDNCMAVGVLLSGSTANGWTQFGSGYDSSKSDFDWPNQSYTHQSPRLLVWLK